MVLVAVSVRVVLMTVMVIAILNVYSGVARGRFRSGGVVDING